MEVIEFDNNTFDYNETVPTTSIVLSALHVLICAVGLIGNLLVIYVVLRYSTMRTVTNTYILNLAIADTCFLIGIPFMTASIMMKVWPFGYFMCKAYMTSSGINQITSSMFVCFMAADRYLAICHPKTAHRFRTTSMARIVSSLAWTVSILMILPIIMYTTLIPVGDGNEESCNIVWPKESYFGARTFTLYAFVMGFAGPLSLIVVFYSSIIITLKNNRSKLVFVTPVGSGQTVTRMVLAVILVYVLCWLPYWVMQITLVYSSYDWNSEGEVIIFFLIASCLSYSNSTINPILYAFLSDNFRKSFMQACSCLMKNTIAESTKITNITVMNNEIGKSEITKLDTKTNGTNRSADV